MANKEGQFALSLIDHPHYFHPLAGKPARGPTHLKMKCVHAVKSEYSKEWKHVVANDFKGKSADYHFCRLDQTAIFNCIGTGCGQMFTQIENEADLLAYAEAPLDCEQRGYVQFTRQQTFQSICQPCTKRYLERTKYPKYHKQILAHLQGLIDLIPASSNKPLPSPIFSAFTLPQIIFLRRFPLDGMTGEKQRFMIQQLIWNIEGIAAAE